MNSRPSAIISPQEGMGGCTPMPKNEKAAYSRMARPISRVATTTRLLNAFGRIYLEIIQKTEQPAALAAAT